MRLVLGSDHAAYDLRRVLADRLTGEGHDVFEVGAPSADRFDYPVASDALVRAVLSGEADFGILLCGTGIGVSIRANRYPGIRAALCTSVEMARLAREHNYANVLCLGARILNEEEAWEITQSFLVGGEDHNARHEHRVELLDSPLG